MTTLEQQIEAVERVEDYYRESMGPRPLKSSPDVRVYDALRAAAETLRAMQWRDDMENAPKGKDLEVSTSDAAGQLTTRAYCGTDGDFYSAIDTTVVDGVYAWRPLPTPAPLPQGEGE